MDIKPEAYFGVNAGKVWRTLKEAGRPMSAREIAKASELKLTDVIGALGWLGREGKIAIITVGKGRKAKNLFTLTE